MSMMLFETITPPCRPSMLIGRQQSLGPAADHSDYMDDFPEKIRVQNVRPFTCDVRDCFDGDEEGVQVYLNVYDVSKMDAIHHINDLFALTESPLKLGGIFHVAVEIFNTEWKYGWVRSGTGVHCGLPRQDRQHHFKQQVRMPRTFLPPEKIAKVIDRLQREFRGQDYDLIDRNCCHFANELSQRLGCGSIPAWVHRGANIVSNLRSVARSLSLGDFAADWNASCKSESRATDDDRRRCALDSVLITEPMRRTCCI